MEAKATFERRPVPTAAVWIAIAAVIAAFMLGGAGGYAVRGLSSVAPKPSATVVTRTPFVVESPPYMTPKPSPVPEPTRDPNGFVIIP